MLACLRWAAVHHRDFSERSFTKSASTQNLNKVVRLTRGVAIAVVCKGACESLLEFAVGERIRCIGPKMIANSDVVLQRRA